MENKFVKLNLNANWSDYTFIFASVSIGNIGQLATDLLISTLQMTKCGYVISEYVQPIVGHDAIILNSNDFSLSCERKTSF
jgi:proteasome assembly chaperone 2